MKINDINEFLLKIPPKFKMNNFISFAPNGEMRYIDTKEFSHIPIDEYDRFLVFLELNDFNLYGNFGENKKLEITEEFKYISRCLFDSNIASPSRRQAGLTSLIIFYAFYEAIVNNKTVIIGNENSETNKYLHREMLNVLKANSKLKSFLNEVNIRKSQNTVFIEINGKIRNVEKIIIDYANKNFVYDSCYFIEEFLKNDMSFKGLYPCNDILKAKVKNFVVYDYFDNRMI